MSEASEKGKEFINRIQNGENPLKTDRQNSDSQVKNLGKKPTTFGLKPMNEGWERSNGDNKQ